ncbi:unnamed protein product [Arabidopsis lyrata]|nr:unnamed protein product [Arabidopsis lyrata]
MSVSGFCERIEIRIGGCSANAFRFQMFPKQNKSTKWQNFKDKML